MDEFQVSIRSSSESCHVWVDGVENARWLLRQLSESFVFQTCEGVTQHLDSSFCDFRVPYNWPLSRTRFENLLRAIPVVNLILERE